MFCLPLGYGLACVPAFSDDTRQQVMGKLKMCRAEPFLIAENSAIFQPLQIGKRYVCPFRFRQGYGATESRRGYKPVFDEDPCSRVHPLEAAFIHGV